MFGEAANLSPTPGVQADVEGALRTVSLTVLDLRLPDKGCSAERVDEVEQTVASSAAAESTNMPPAVRTRNSPNGTDPESPSTVTGELTTESDDEDVFSDPVPNWVNEPSADARSQCGGRLIPMWAADEYLRDSVWRASKSEETLIDLKRTYLEWKGLSESTVADLDPPD